MVVSRRPFVGFASSASGSPPAPLAAHLAPPAASVIFDQPIQPGPSDPAVWLVRTATNRYPVTAAVAAGNTVSLSLGTPIFGSFAAGVTYSPPPNTVLGLSGSPAAPFGPFPFT